MDVDKNMIFGPISGGLNASLISENPQINIVVASNFSDQLEGKEFGLSTADIKDNGNTVTTVVSPPNTIDFTALAIIIYTKEITIECIHTMFSSEKNMFQKIWSVFRLVNNIMNTEAYFFLSI